MASKPKKVQTAAKRQQKKAGVQKQAPKGRSFRQWNLPATSSVNDLLTSLVSKYHKDSAGNFYHIVSCSLKNIWEADAWVPISCGFRREHFPAADLDQLVEDGLLEKWWFSQGDHRCNRYRIKRELIELINELTLRDLLENPNTKIVNVFTGRQVNALRSSFCDANGHRIPANIEQHIRSYSACLFNRTRILWALQEDCAEQQRLKHQLGPNHPKYLKAFRQFTVSVSCMKSVQAARPVPFRGDLWIYNAPYEMQESGRLTHLGGGFQNAPKRIQSAAFADIEGYRNYDMVSSQPNLVIQELTRAGLDPSWLVKYRDTPKAKHLYSKLAGLSVDTWKDCLNSVLMGTEVFDPAIALKSFTNLDRAKKRGKVNVDRYCALLKYIYEETSDPTQAAAIYKRFYELIKPLVEVRNQWHQWLIDQYIPANRKLGTNNKYFIAGGCVGTRLYYEEYKGPKLKAKVSAFLLQSQESAYVTALAALAPEHNYQMKAHYYDGFICQGEVPVEAQQRAAEMSGTINAELVEKPFENPFAEPEKADLEAAREAKLRSTFTGIKQRDLTLEQRDWIDRQIELEELAATLAPLPDFLYESSIEFFEEEWIDPF